MRCQKKELDSAFDAIPIHPDCKLVVPTGSGANPAEVRERLMKAAESLRDDSITLRKFSSKGFQFVSLSHSVEGGPGPDIRPVHNEHDAELFRMFGYKAAQPLSSGMESATYLLSNDLVGKVWARRSVDQVTKLALFYETLRRSGLPFVTPFIHRIEEIDGRVVSTEALLPGRPFSEADASTNQDGIGCLVNVLGALGAVDVSSVPDVPVLDELLPMSSSTFTNSLINLVRRRADQFRPQLRAAVDQFEEKLIGIEDLLNQVPTRPAGLIHGDLGGGNLLVDSDLRPVTVLDFGFLTMNGDPCFDAAITAGVFDMWSPKAQFWQHEFDRELNRSFGYEAWELLVYRAAYAVVISNAYDPDGKDGQFWWSASLLNRQDVHELLLLPS